MNSFSWINSLKFGKQASMTSFCIGSLGVTLDIRPAIILLPIFNNLYFQKFIKKNMSCYLLKMGWKSYPVSILRKIMPTFIQSIVFTMCVQNAHTISFSLICPIYIESSVWRYHTFALTQPYPRIQLPSNTLFNKIFQSWKLSIITWLSYVKAYKKIIG